MSSETGVAIPALIVQAASPEHYFESRVSPITELSEPPSSSSNNESIDESYDSDDSNPSPGTDVRRPSFSERRPSLAERRQSRQDSSKPARILVPLQTDHQTTNAAAPTPTGAQPSRRKSRWSSLDIGHFGLSYVPQTPFGIDLERQRTSIREAFDRSQLHLHHFGEKIEQKLGWNERVRHYTWNFFSMTMATGGIANVLHSVPFRFRGLDVIGIIFFIFNLFLFIFNCVMISIRFTKYSETLKASLVHPTESLFVPCGVVSLGTVILNIAQYGIGNTGPWLDQALLVLFWFYVGVAIVASISVYLLIWSTHTFTIAQMTPIWIFPAYPLLLVGPIAGYLANNLPSTPPNLMMLMILGGFTCQGVGFLVSLTIYSAFMYRLMTQKLPTEGIRPGMFVSVGPSAFTSDALVQLAAGAVLALPDGFMDSIDLGIGTDNKAFAALVVRMLGDAAALWVWGLAFWFFFVSVGAHWSCVKKEGGLEFAMTWFSFVFPNSALIAATFAIGEAFESDGIKWIGCVMTALLTALWVFVFGAMIRAILKKQVLWPQKQEDRDEGGFKSPPPMKRSFFGQHSFMHWPPHPSQWHLPHWAHFHWPGHGHHSHGHGAHARGRSPSVVMSDFAKKSFRNPFSHHDKEEEKRKEKDKDPAHVV